jgi:hypothetical protein
VAAIRRIPPLDEDQRRPGKGPSNNKYKLTAIRLIPPLDEGQRRQLGKDIEAVIEMGADKPSVFQQL